MILEKPVKMLNLLISSPFGRRYHPIDKVWKGHCGIDIIVPKGAVVFAVADGIVKITSELRGYGYVVYIDHGEIEGKRVETRYAHLSKFLVKAWDKVTLGQKIALSGGVPGEKGAGASTGAHLHFELRLDGVPVNPLEYFSDTTKCKYM